MGVNEDIIILSMFDVVENGRRPNRGVDGVVVRIMS